MVVLSFLNLTLPLADPVLKFLIILVIILFAPLLLNKLRIPHLFGLILAGVAIGPHGFNLLARDSSIILSGTAGLLYVMFLSGLEIDLEDFRRNSKKSTVFGLYTFIVPMILGYFAGYFLLNFSVLSSVLLASMFASHTLIAYPIVSKLGIAKNPIVSISVGGTLIADTLALLVLAVVVAAVYFEMNSAFQLQLATQLLVFGLVVMVLFPVIGKWFFRRFTDNVAQYVFVLVMVFFGAVLAELAGTEAIVGAFLTGLALNRLIPATSPLMNRVEFVGNAIFIPFFLIGVGMLIDYRDFYRDLETLKVAAVMTVVATMSKYLAALFTQKTLHLSADERRVLFGLSNAQAAATLAAVTVGYNVILDYTAAGEPVRLLNESVLNGTVLMTLVTCTIATFVTQKGAKNIAISDLNNVSGAVSDGRERVLVTLSNPATADSLVHLAVLLGPVRNSDDIFTLNVIVNQHMDSEAADTTKKLLENAEQKAETLGAGVQPLFRYDLNISNGISGVVKEKKITDLVLGFNMQKEGVDPFRNFVIEEVLSKCNTTSFILKPGMKPINEYRRHRIIIPEHAEKELGFLFWLLKMWNLARNTGAELEFYASNTSLQLIKSIHAKYPVPSKFRVFAGWEFMPTLITTLQPDDNLVVIMSRKDKPSYHDYMTKIPFLLGSSLIENGFILLYPMQAGIEDANYIDLKDPTFMEPLEKFEVLRKKIIKLIKRFMRRFYVH
jgi:Kef-type K+ transport system membrane component KefB